MYWHHLLQQILLYFYVCGSSLSRRHNLHVGLVWILVLSVLECAVQVDGDIYDITSGTEIYTTESNQVTSSSQLDTRSDVDHGSTSFDTTPVGEGSKAETGPSGQDLGEIVLPPREKVVISYEEYYLVERCTVYKRKYMPQTSSVATSTQSTQGPSKSPAPTKPSTTPAPSSGKQDYSLILILAIAGCSLMLIAVIFLTPYIYNKIIHPLILRHERAKHEKKRENAKKESEEQVTRRTSTITGRTSLQFAGGGGGSSGGGSSEPSDNEQGNPWLNFAQVLRAVPGLGTEIDEDDDGNIRVLVDVEARPSTSTGGDTESAAIIIENPGAVSHTSVSKGVKRSSRHSSLEEISDQESRRHSSRRRRYSRQSSSSSHYSKKGKRYKGSSRKRKRSKKLLGSQKDGESSICRSLSEELETTTEIHQTQNEPPPSQQNVPCNTVVELPGAEGTSREGTPDPSPAQTPESNMSSYLPDSSTVQYPATSLVSPSLMQHISDGSKASSEQDTTKKKTEAIVEGLQVASSDVARSPSAQGISHRNPPLIRTPHCIHESDQSMSEGGYSDISPVLNEDTLLSESLSSVQSASPESNKESELKTNSESLEHNGEDIDSGANHISNSEDVVLTSELCSGIGKCLCNRCISKTSPTLQSSRLSPNRSSGNEQGLQLVTSKGGSASLTNRKSKAQLLLEPNSVVKTLDGCNMLNNNYHLVGAKNLIQTSDTSAYATNNDSMTQNHAVHMELTPSQRRRADALKNKFASDSQRRESDDSAIVSDLELEVLPESCVVDLDMIHEEDYQSDQV